MPSRLYTLHCLGSFRINHWLECHYSQRSSPGYKIRSACRKGRPKKDLRNIYQGTRYPCRMIPLFSIRGKRLCHELFGWQCDRYPKGQQICGIFYFTRSPFPAELCGAGLSQHHTRFFTSLSFPCVFTLRIPFFFRARILPHLFCLSSPSLMSVCIWQFSIV